MPNNQDNVYMEAQKNVTTGHFQSKRCHKTAADSFTESWPF